MDKMSHSKLLDSPVLSLIPSNMDKMLIIDVASGLGLWAFYMRMFKEGNPVIIGLDIWIPYLEKVKKHNLYDHLIQADAKHPPFREGIFDLLIGCELIEHFSKQEGLEVIKEMERISRKRIILSTPYGFYFQEAIKGNMWEEHKSVWYPSDLEQLGYNIEIVRYYIPRSLVALDKIRRFIFRIPEFRLIVAFRDLYK